MRSEPIVFLSFVQGDLQGAYAYGQQRKPDVVEPGKPLLLAGQIRRILDAPIQQQQRHRPHWNVEVENPAPRVAIGDPPSQRRTDGRSADRRDSIQRKGQPSLRGRKRIAKDRLRHWLQASSERALQDPKQE